MVDIYFCHTDGNADVSPRISLQSDGPGEIGFLDMVFVLFSYQYGCLPMIAFMPMMFCVRFLRA